METNERSRLRTRIYTWLYFRVCSAYMRWYFPEIPPHVEGEKGHFTKGEKVSLTILAAIVLVVVVAGYLVYLAGLSAL